MSTNLILDTDSYKESHFLQLPPKSTYASGYIEARGYSKEVYVQPEAGIVHFGLQAYLIEKLSQKITRHHVDEAEDIVRAHGEPFNRTDWDKIVNRYGGYVPIEIFSLPEGTVSQPGRPLVRTNTTDKDMPWLATYFETPLIRSVWYPSTVATISRNIKLLIKQYMLATAGHIEGLDFKLHDFGARGVSSEESSVLGGMAHLINFMGTDTLASLAGVRNYYNGDQYSVAGFSIPAAEHSTITSWGRENEVEAYRNMINKFGGPGKIYAVVSDSYDIYNACENLWGGVLKQEILDKGGTLVVRPDSGDPKSVILRCLEILGDKFGTTTNQLGYKVLPSCVRIIQGDGVEYRTINEILSAMMDAGWSAENINFGMGGALLQKVNRDTFKYAMKMSAIMVDGEWVDVYKDPVTDKGKKSKRGIQHDPEFVKVFRNGEVFNQTDFESVRERAKV